MKTVISEYEQQAIDFAEKHNVKLTVLGSDYRKYWDSDKKKRYVFKLKLSRKNRSHTFTFGQSIASGSKEPSPYDVLSCLTKYDPGTFENFCGDFGYDTDSLMAKKTYKAVVKEWESVNRLFSDCLEELAEIQ